MDQTVGGKAKTHLRSPREKGSRRKLLLCYIAGIVTVLVFQSLTSSSSSYLHHHNHHHYNCHDALLIKRTDDGWKDIHVFVGDQDGLIVPDDLKDRPYVSQEGQDRIVFQLLRNRTNGFFLDLAANDAIKISNTYSLEKLHNWTGICVEANPTYWDGLVFRNCEVVAAVVGPERMKEVQFRFGLRKDWAVYSGTVGNEYDNKEDQVFHRLRKGGFTDLPRHQVQIGEILRRYNAPASIDYLSLDVEGMEYVIMNSYPLLQYPISILTIERPTLDLETFLFRNGYLFLKVIIHWGETVWARRNVLAELDLSVLNVTLEEVIDQSNKCFKQHTKCAQHANTV